MIKCSICSYQCDNWYASNWRLSCHIYFCRGSVSMSLLRSLHVLCWHCTKPVAAHPTGVTMLVRGLWRGFLQIFVTLFLLNLECPRLVSSVLQPGWCKPAATVFFASSCTLICDMRHWAAWIWKLLMFPSRYKNGLLEFHACVSVCLDAVQIRASLERTKVSWLVVTAITS